MHILKKKLSGSTALKYFFSYLIIITVLIVGFFFVLKQQITDNYFTFRSEQAQVQLDNIASQFHDNLIYLSQVDSAIVSDLELIEGRYKEADAYNYQALMELREYASTTKLISSIVYMPRKTNKPLSTQLPVSYTDGSFSITSPSMKTITFDPTPYFNAISGQLVFLSDEQLQYLLYFPAISQRANYIFFYILDTASLQQQFKGITSEEILSVALIDQSRQLAVSLNPTALLPYIASVPLENGIYRQDDSSFVCVRTGISRGFSMLSLSSQNFLTDQINSAFASSYLALLGLSVIGFLLVVLAMWITYLPLHRLTQKIVPNADRTQGYLNQLESAFSEAENQNQLLKGKLENYRLSMQKSLLDAIVITQYPGATASWDIDQLFDSTSRNKLYILHMKAPAGSFPWDDIQQILSRNLPDNGTCILLEPKPNGAVFLINYTGDTQDKDEQLKNMCLQFHKEYGYLSAISNGSDSPLDIPALYENAMYAGSYWPHQSVAEFKSLPLAAASFAYPHDSLNNLSQLLAENNFTATRLVVNELFALTNLYITKKGNLTNFFVQCILIDILTILTNHMNLSYIKFYDYSDLYFETLSFCRNCPYTEKAKDIQSNIGKLIDFCEQAISEKTITSAPLIKIIEENYCQPDFSIAVLADKFHVSVAHMSHLFKKELNVNFSDYLWSMRQKKAQALLRATDLSIEDISIAVGYVNTSSFRRKFKQETGLTPSQYRGEGAEKAECHD